jgi:REP element-mobilizing transposase RayT
MPDKFRNKYRISSARLKNWDYGSDALYFVTICTQNREHYFGEIADGKMQLSETGKMANRFWFEIPNHFPFVQLGEFVVMPNHIHGIIIVDKTTKFRNNDFIEMVGDAGDGVIIDALGNAIVETPKLGVSTVPPTTNETTKTTAASAKWKPGILGSIINQYKRICTINARKINPGFSWQPRFHDHIIRNHKSFQRISDYIVNNPVIWRDDNFY